MLAVKAMNSHGIRKGKKCKNLDYRLVVTFALSFFSAMMMRHHTFLHPTCLYFLITVVPLSLSVYKQILLLFSYTDGGFQA